jgi:hypothetical protein
MPTGNEKWIREYELVFSSPDERLEITSLNQRDPLDISFSITYDPASNSQGTMALDIYGLGESSVSKVMKVGVKCWLSVGHKSTGVTQIFVGDVREGKVASDSGKHVTKLKVMSTRTDTKPIQSTLPSGGSHKERIKLMLGLMRDSLPSLSINGALVDIERMATEENTVDALKRKGLEGRVSLNDDVFGSLTINGTLMDSLTKMLETFNIKAVTINDSIRLTRGGGAVRDVNSIQAILGENLLNPPRKRLDNMTVPTNTANSKKTFELTMLLEPTAIINSVVVASHIREDGGEVTERPTVLRITEVSHKGKYRGNAWHTYLTGSVSEDYLLKAPVGSTALDVRQTYKDPEKSKSGSKALEETRTTGSGFTGSW